MSLTVKQLNGDASFLLTLQPTEIGSPGGNRSQDPYRILLDPWIVGPSSVIHSRFSSTSRVQKACVSSLQDLPEPDLVVISDSRSDHCNEATLRQLPASGSKTIILAEPMAAKLIRSWRYFDDDKVQTLQRWQDPRKTGLDTVFKVPIYPKVLGGEEGVVTVSYIAHKKGRMGLQSAVAITYRPAPSTRGLVRLPTAAAPPSPPSPTTPPASPAISHVPSAHSSHSSHTQISRISTATTLYMDAPTPVLPPLPKFAPLLSSGRASPPPPPPPPRLRPKLNRALTATSSPRTKKIRGVSVIFSPHGISYTALEPFATSHLMGQASLPLTALLHCFDTVSRPWWLGGDLTSGFEAGQEIADSLGARAWISTYDGEKTIKGIASKVTRRKRYQKENVQDFIQRSVEVIELDRKGSTQSSSKKGEKPTEILALAAGEEVTLTSEGIWDFDPIINMAPKRFSLRHVSNPDAHERPASMVTYGVSKWRSNAPSIAG